MCDDTCKICEEKATKILELNYSVNLCKKHYDLITDITERVIDAFEYQTEDKKDA